MRTFIFALLFSGVTALFSSFTMLSSGGNPPTDSTDLIITPSNQPAAAPACAWREPNVNESTTLVVTGVGSYPATITAVYSGSEAFDFTYVKSGSTHYVYEFKFDDWIEISSNNFMIGSDNMP